VDGRRGHGGLDELDPTAVDHLVVRRRRHRDGPTQVIRDPHPHVAIFAVP
jgi:hypothetical protein